MIKSERQLASARNKLEDVERVLGGLTTSEDRAPYEELAHSIRQEIDEFVAIRDDRIVEFDIPSLDGLGGALIRARLARHLTQRELAERLGVKEQQVQRWERDRYETASLWRVAEVADALDYRMSGLLSPAPAAVGSPG